MTMKLRFTLARLSTAVALAGLVWCAAAALAQNQNQNQSQSMSPNSANGYRPVYPNYGGGGGYYGGWGGWGGNNGVGSTAAGSYMAGMASVISAAGQANLANSAAANNWEAAYSSELNNRLQYANTYFEMRRVNRAATTEERGPRPTAEELARYAKEAAPNRLTASQPRSGDGRDRLAGVAPRFGDNAQRQKVDELFAAREQSNGAVGQAAYRQVQDAIDALRDVLRQNIKDYNPQTYVDARKFLDSLQYEARFAG